MKCGYCGKRLAGEGEYCSERCRKQGFNLTRFETRTRIPFWVLTILAALTFLIGCILIVTGNLSYAFVMIGIGVSLMGITLVALPRGNRKANTLCQIFGGFLFAMGLLCILFWH